MSDLINDYWTKTNPVEGIPEIQHDWDKEYASQRKNRMQDCIDDYLQDDRVSARRAYEEILSCVDDVINYHKKEYEKAVELKSLMLGHRDSVSFD